MASSRNKRPLALELLYLGSSTLIGLSGPELLPRFLQGFYLVSTRPCNHVKVTNKYEGPDARDCDRRSHQLPVWWENIDQPENENRYSGSEHSHVASDLSN